MASYTMQLREYIEQATQDENLSSREQIAKGKAKLFDFDYPIFDAAYKNVFETNFIRNFYMREIGFETEGLFKFQLETWMLINMPYFNKLFESELLQFDPLANSEMSVTHNKTNDKIQNDNRDKTQNDERNKSQNDNRDITQNDNRTLLKNDNRGIHQNDSTTKNQDGTVKSTTTQVTDQTSDMNSTSEDSTDVKASSESTKLVNGADAIDNFTRELKSETPDSRLALTTQDGKGVIEYASQINEDLEKNKKVWDNRTLADGTSDTNTKSLSTNKQDSTSNSDTTNTEDTTTSNDESGSLVSTIDDTLVSSTDDMLISSTDDTLVSNVDDTLNSTVNDKLTSSINDIEDYVQHRVGKIGVQSYSKMVQEYRESFLRIEKQIFNEMNELFMLVY